MDKRNTSSAIFAGIGLGVLLLVYACSVISEWSNSHANDVRTMAVVIASIIGFLAIGCIILVIRDLRKKADEIAFRKGVERKKVALALERESMANDLMRLQLIEQTNNIESKRGYAQFPQDSIVVNAGRAAGNVVFPYAPGGNKTIITEEETSEGIIIPSAPAWPQIADKITGPNNIMLGYGVDGPIYGNIDDLLSTGIIGKPGKGKTTTMLFHIAQLIKVGATALIMDPHGSLADLRGVLDYATNRNALVAIQALENELDARLDAYEDGKRDFPPYMALIDEFVKMSAAFPELAPVVERVILEGRKVKMYLIISSQAFHAAHFGGTEARDNLSSRMVHYCRSSQARLIGLEKDAINTYLNALRGKAGIGVCVLDCDSRDDIELAAIPQTTADDIANLVRERPYTKIGIPQRPAALNGPSPIPNIPEIGENDEQNILSEERERRKKLLAKVAQSEKDIIIEKYIKPDVSRSRILRESGKGHDYYRIIKAVCDEYDEQQRAS